MPDHAQRLAVEAPEAADDRFVLAELAIAGERCEIGEECTDIVEAMRTLGMARNLSLLPRRELGIEFLQRGVRLAL